MNLINCSWCGVVLNQDALPFADDIYNDEGSVDLTKAVWVGDRYVPFVVCPVCGCGVFKELK